MRRAARVDANQKEIVRAWRQVGARVALTHMVGNGFPDAVVGFRGQVRLFEIKDGSKSPSARRLTPDEEKFIGLWGDLVTVVSSVDEALAAIGATPLS